MRKPVLLSVLLTFLAAGCEPQDVAWSEPRTVSADKRPTKWGTSAMERLGLGSVEPSVRQYVGEAPAGWNEQPAQPARFRDRLWHLADDAETECYLTNAVGGGVAGNLSRWYGQFGIGEPAAVESLPVIEFAGRPGRLLELSGTFTGKPDFAMLLAFRSQGDIVTTLKMTGPKATVQAHREEFLELAKTLRGSSAGPDPTAPPIERGQQMPPDHPPVDGAGDRDTSPPPSPFVAEVPADWSPVPGSQRLMHHSFGDGGELYVSQLGGTIRAMLDIWRGEIAGLGVLTDAEFEAVGSVAMLGGEGSLLDVAGDFRSMSGKQLADARMLVAAIDQSGSIVFVKLVGKAAEVEAQMPNFLQFCRSLRRRS